MDNLLRGTLFVLCLFSLTPDESSADISYGETLTPAENNRTRQLIDTLNIPSRASSARQRVCRMSSTRTAVSDTVSCPWYYTINTDNNRYPRQISNATLKTCPENSGRYCLHYLPTGRFTINMAGVCTEVLATFPVIRYLRDQTGNVTSHVSTENVVLGYTCQWVPVSSSTAYHATS